MHIYFTMGIVWIALYPNHNFATRRIRSINVIMLYVYTINFIV